MRDITTSRNKEHMERDGNVRKGDEVGEMERVGTCRKGGLVVRGENERRCEQVWLHAHNTLWLLLDRGER